MFGTSPAIVRSPTIPQNAAGIRIEQPKSVPCAGGIVPVATAPAEPPDDPARLRVGFHGLRVGPKRACGCVAQSRYTLASFETGMAATIVTLAASGLSRKKRAQAGAMLLSVRLRIIASRGAIARSSLTIPHRRAWGLFPYSAPVLHAKIRFAFLRSNGRHRHSTYFQTLPDDALAAFAVSASTVFFEPTPLKKAFKITTTMTVSTTPEFSIGSSCFGR